MERLFVSGIENDIAEILNNPNTVRHYFEGTEILELTELNDMNILINLQVGNIYVWYGINEDLIHLIDTSKIDIPFVKKLIDERIVVLRNDAIENILS